MSGWWPTDRLVGLNTRASNSKQRGFPIKTIIAGGRLYKFTEADKALLDRLWKELPITEVVSGNAYGADMEGWNWAYDNEIPIKDFPAQWSRWGVDGAVVGVREDGSKYNKLAGFWGNAQMAEYAEALIAFPGGTGTADMIQRATERKLLILVVKDGATQFNPLDHEQTK